MLAVEDEKLERLYWRDKTWTLTQSSRCFKRISWSNASEVALIKRATQLTTHILLNHNDITCDLTMTIQKKHHYSIICHFTIIAPITVAHKAQYFALATVDAQTCPLVIHASYSGNVINRAAGILICILAKLPRSSLVSIYIASVTSTTAHSPCNHLA